ncbi:Longin-like domain-containing protein [Xylariaceae sp. FL1272]|nr:Longin-like domain-containing protein [Xylariaceae sp. FL1272]
MANTVPSIACLGVISRSNNPLHISIFPSYDSASNSYLPIRTPLQFSLLLSGTLDIFEHRSKAASPQAPGSNSMLLSGDYGLLHAIDERLAAYGFETNTGVKFVAVVDMRGRGPNTTTGSSLGGMGGKGGTGVGLRDSELRPVFKAMQTAYVHLLQNPFYDPEEGGPEKGKRITSKRFAEKMRHIGETWAPGVTTGL